MSASLTIRYFAHSWVSDWNHGNAHFLRGLARELGRLGHKVRCYEELGSWSLSNLVASEGERAIQAIDECRAHGTRLNLFFAKHQVIDDQRPARRGKQFAQPNAANRRIAIVQLGGAFFKGIILQRRALRKPPAEIRDALLLLHQFDFSETEFFALRQIIDRFVG